MHKEPWIIVGLGNPGPKYGNTRHNIGFMAVDCFAKKRGWHFKEEKLFDASIAKGEIEGEEIILLKPLTFMNLSGNAVRKFLDFYKQKWKKLLIVYDDADLSFGELRLKGFGGSGGHNGLKSLELQLQTQEFPRLKVGIGRSDTLALADYVLQSFTVEENNQLPQVMERVQEALLLFIKEPLAKAMNRINFKEKKNERREEKPL